MGLRGKLRDISGHTFTPEGIGRMQLQVIASAALEGI